MYPVSVKGMARLRAAPCASRPEVQQNSRAALRRLHACRTRLELIQDFEFPAAAHRIKATQDGAFIYASGIHPPRVLLQPKRTPVQLALSLLLQCWGHNP